MASVHGLKHVEGLAAPHLAAHHLINFPACLANAPMLLPDTGSGMRRLLEEYFSQRQIRPHIVAEFGDSALMKSFGQEGAGIFPVPSLVSDAVTAQYRVVKLGELEGPVLSLDHLPWELNIDPATGDIDQVVHGQWFDGQEPAGVVTHRHLRGNLVEALRRVVRVASDTDRHLHVDAPGLFLDGLSLD